MVVNGLAIPSLLRHHPSAALCAHGRVDPGIILPVRDLVIMLGGKAVEGVWRRGSPVCLSVELEDNSLQSAIHRSG